ncbi:bifunctional glycosyltransferase family 2/GtrA family protein [Streptococcus suis]|uniref:bifunctional glycosyltransferase family 2/GtrA family protein n=1 Tax=Streptococcus suis TaxID=1307 RepID=UPI000CF5B051|nr:bifunctional glycosyltransferase family 2/GtrA family protein [Streptococcus suis]
MYYVVIPAYQPDEKLIQLLEIMKNRLNCQVIVVDDGSTGTSKNILEIAKTYAIVLHHDVNKGKGQALRTAFSFIQDLRKPGVIVTADADGQHAVNDIDRIARATMNLPSRLILGVRQFTKDIPFRSRFGNKLTRVLFRLQTGVNVSDTQTGLRGFHTDLIPFMLDIEGDRYEYEMNMLTQASQRYKITEVPIQTIYIDDNASSHFRPIKDGLLIYKNLFKFALASFGGFLVDYGVYALALLLITSLPTALRLLVANTIARICSATCNFALNKKLVFNIARTGAGYFTLALVLFLCDTALLYLFHQILGLNLYIVKLAVDIFLFLASWFVQKNIIFKERKSFSHEIA